MNQLSIITMPDGMEAVDSREVAVAVGREHHKLMRDIRNYCEYLGESKIGLSDFFIESTYTSEQNKELPCYLITKKGCDMIANKMTGQKGVVFTAMYVNAFHDMHKHIQMQAAEIQRMEAEARKNRAIAMRINAENRRMKMLLEHPNMDKISPIALETLGLKRLEEIKGADVGNALPQTEQTYSATEVGQMLGGITANKIGSTAKKNGIKTDVYGTWVNDKSRYSDKQVPSFRYNMAGVRKLGEILGVEVIP